MDATEWTATLAAPLPPSPRSAPDLSPPPPPPRLLFPVLSTLFPSPCAPREMVGWAGSGLHPRSHLFIIKFHVYRQPVRWRSEFLSECVHTRPRGGKRERRHGRTHMHAHTPRCMHAYTGERTHRRTRASSRVDSSASLFRFFSFSLSLFLSREGAGRRGFARRSI